MKSLEALVAAVIALLVALGIAGAAIAKLKKVRKALHTVAVKIEEHKNKGLKKNIGKHAPKDTAVGAIIHAAAKKAEETVKNGNGK